jgi:uncharacterized protein YbjQ (UPF0145 family)
MKNLAKPAVVVILLSFAALGQARNTIEHVSIESALAWGRGEGTINDSVGLYFGDQSHPAVAKSLGTFTSNKKTNAFGKSDEKACQWAFLSAMVSLQERAISMGGNAVINIRSYYYQNDFSSATEFECGAGALMAGVTMVGDVVKLAE